MADKEQPFTRASLKFLTDLAANNERPWFDAHKARYEAHVLEPALAFIEQMAPAIDGISKHFSAVPKRVGGSLMRVYRDTRFSRDKSPYKTNVGIQFRHERGKDVHAPGFYVHIEPKGCFLGAGIWHPEAGALEKIRLAIAADPAGWKRAAYGKRFADVFALSGGSLKRPPRGFAADSPVLDDLKRKDYIAVSSFADREAIGAEFPALAAARFRAAKPLMRFLCVALELQF